LFSPAVARHLPDLFAVVTGPRVAVFHDAIALRFPELTPTKTVARFPAYLQELACFDGIAAISEDSAACLRDYWAWLGFRDAPPIAVFQPGLALPPAAAGGSEAAPGAPPVVLSVGSIEGRKNHRALLDACEGLWREGQKFELQLIGLAQPATGAAALARIRELQSAGRPLRYAGPLPDAMLQAAYADCAFTVYPSLVEGFGLPVIESLAHGKPCICSGRGALGEVARDGGCLALEKVEAADLEAALRRLLENPAELARLAASARARTFRSWRDYQTDLHAWMRGLSRRC
jgi:glycosyltransferase involved in cell wall biosynthesis